MIGLLESSGLGLPAYYRWRSRSGCTFCFYQQKIEWVRLMREHPEAFEEAKSYEKTALERGSPFTWTERESLEELARPERVAQIEKDYEARVARLKARKPVNALRARLTDEDIVWCGRDRRVLPRLSQVATFIRTCWPSRPLSRTCATAGRRPGTCPTPTSVPSPRSADPDRSGLESARQSARLRAWQSCPRSLGAYSLRTSIV